MELWNEYEGRTIDGVFPLAKLLQPEGRSAFFSTPNGTGTPAVIRLIEAHFDDQEILARWRGVAALNHPNLVKLKTFGRVEMDGAPLVYAVMEPADANLGEIIAERRLTVQETMQLATSLVAAIGTLHAHGFVHEHVEPGNVLAVGEEIKLRSDCIRETPEGAEGSDLKRKDVHDLAVVLLRALTQRRTLEDAAGDLPLAAPFNQIVRKGMSGEWGLAEIEVALAQGESPQADSRVVETVGENRRVAPVERSFSAAEIAALLPPPPPARAQGMPRPMDEAREGMFPGRKIALWLGVMLVLLLAWFFLRGRPAEQSSAAPAPAASAPGAAVSATATAPVVTKPSAAVNAPRAAVTKPSPVVNVPRAAASPGASANAAPVASSAGAAKVGDRVDWRVIVVTYNHEDQAKAKAARIAETHPEMQPDVFSPSGQAPYLVTIGGVMTRDEAYALAQKARGEGFPSETYAQNYRKR